LYDTLAPDVIGDPWVAKFREIFDKACKDPDMGIPEGRYYFLVILPFAEDDIFAFFFALRDESAVSPLRPAYKGGISEFCQEAILETCSGVIGELYEFKYEEARERIRLAAWQSLSARTAHKIANRTFAARGALRRQRQANPNFVGIPELEFAVEKIGLICNDFGRFVTEQPLNLQMVNVENLIQKEVAPFKQADLEKAIETNIRSSLPQCRWDPVQISQAIAELLENAIIYTPKGGRITIGAEIFQKDSESVVKMVIYNDGPGVERANKAKIFEPFFSTRPDGAGLGLAIAAKIIEAHKGIIREIGEPGKNARFVIEIPVTPQLES
jgi:signal transduction histidine kinase